jgi:hypothetical protein
MLKLVAKSEYSHGGPAKILLLFCMSRTRESYSGEMDVMAVNGMLLLFMYPCHHGM